VCTLEPGATEDLEIDHLDNPIGRVLVVVEGLEFEPEVPR